MAATDQVAGHPIAIRVGGRRMSQSNPRGSPTKQQTSSASSSPEDGGAGVAEVPDYPRPRSPPKEEPVPTVGQDEQQQGGGQNRQERRRQERRREKSNRDEQQNASALSQQNDAMFNHLRKGGERMTHASSQKGANGIRITQPAQKFMV